METVILLLGKIWGTLWVTAIVLTILSDWNNWERLRDVCRWVVTGLTVLFLVPALWFAL